MGGLTAYGAITACGLLVAISMWLIGRWYVFNCRNHGGEMHKLLTIARSDKSE